MGRKCCCTITVQDRGTILGKIDNFAKFSEKLKLLFFKDNDSAFHLSMFCNYEVPIQKKR